jgi:hypothetical protein
MNVNRFDFGQLDLNAHLSPPALSLTYSPKLRTITEIAVMGDEGSSSK